jgi:hypothetical protein
MAFDPELHEICPDTGFMLDKKTGARVYIDPIPHPRGPGSEYPKYVVPHEGHLHRKGDHVSSPHFDVHVGRDGAVTALVLDAEHEAFALAEPATPKTETE